MYQENNQRTLQSSVSNPPSENLQTFLLKRIRAIMTKEWWDFIVNVNSLNSDHASLLYSLANLCPSFNYFLQSKDKELQIIIKKRPIVKPRIFSGTERIDTTPDPIVPKQLPLITRRNSATELVKILNELYPNENAKCKQPRPYGPSSKQRKSSQIPNKKNLSANTSVDSTKKSNLPNEIFPQLTRILDDDSQKENADSIYVKKLTQSQISMPILVEDNEGVCKAILSNTNYDLNQNRLNQGPKKIKKIIKVKKKRYVYSNALTDSKNRLKYILEDETPNLSLKLIKKYRIKKCSVDLTRLKDSVINYYVELRFRNFIRSLNSEPNEETQLTTTMREDGDCNNFSIKSCTPSSPLSTEKEKETIEKKVTEKSCNENVRMVEKFNPKELKNMYCHGGIVPLGNVITSDKGNDIKIKHFLSLKEKKVKDIISNTIATILQPKENITEVEKITEKTTNSDTRPLVSEVLQTTDSIVKETQLDDSAMESNEHISCNDKSAHNNINMTINMEDKSETYQSVLPHISEKINDNFQKEELKTSEVSSNHPNDCRETDSIDNNEAVIVNMVSEITYSDDITNATPNEASEQNRTICNENPESVSMTGINGTLVCSNDKSTDVNEVEEHSISKKSEEIQRNEIPSVVDKSVSTNSAEIFDVSLESCEKKNINFIENNDAVFNGNEVLEPLNKRPRLEVNLAEMKLEITKTLVESGNNVHFCKMCQLSFDSLETWNKHFENNVPKCTPNLQVTWDSTELLN